MPRFYEMQSTGVHDSLLLAPKCCTIHFYISKYKYIYMLYKCNCCCTIKLTTCSLFHTVLYLLLPLNILFLSLHCNINIHYILPSTRLGQQHILMRVCSKTRIKKSFKVITAVKDSGHKTLT